MRSNSVLSSVYADGKDAMGINAKEIGSRIRKLRMERGLTQQCLADTLGVTLSCIGRVECGLRMASIDLLVDIAGYFHVSLDYIVLGKN